MKIERDGAEATGGIRHGRTLGGPIALTIANRDYANWAERMNPWPVEAAVEEVHLPRPGHADLAGVTKYGLSDVRDVLERASARETAARVAGGAVCRAFLRALGVEVVSHVRRSAPSSAPAYPEPLALERFADVDALAGALPRRRRPRAAMVEHINVQRRANESLGGVFEVRAYGLVAGLGSHVSWEERLDGRLAGALCSIQAVKGVGLGEGFALAAKPGLAGARRDLPLRRARLLPRDQPLGRPRGRHDDRRAADRDRGDEAAADADQAAALGRHRDARAGRGAARAHRLLHGAGGAASSARRWSRSCSPTPTGASSAATTSTTCAPRSPPTGSGSGERRAARSS